MRVPDHIPHCHHFEVVGCPGLCLLHILLFDENDQIIADMPMDQHCCDVLLKAIHDGLYARVAMKG